MALFHTASYILPHLAGQSFNTFLAIDPIIGAKRERIYLGDYISIKCADKSKYYGQLSQLSDSVIYIDGTKIKISEIKKVKFSSRSDGLRLLSGICFRAGLGYFVVVGVNGVINDDSPIVSEQAIKLSGGFLALGITAALLNQKSIKIKHDWQIKIIDLNPLVKPKD